jgi:hypothetical protein
MNHVFVAAVTDGRTDVSGAEVMHRERNSIRTKTLAGGLGVLVLLSASAQAPRAQITKAPSGQNVRTVPLVSDACPEVHRGDLLALDWNPGFAPGGPVAGLRSFRLVFAPVVDDSVNPKVRVSFSAGGKGGSPAATSVTNGYYHIEVPVTQVPEGVYRLVDAAAAPEVFPGLDGEAIPQMTVSPVQDRFCITVVTR